MRGRSVVAGELLCGGSIARGRGADQRAVGGREEPDVARTLTVDVAWLAVAREQVQRPHPGAELVRSIGPLGYREDGWVEVGRQVWAVDQDRGPGVGARAVTGRLPADVVQEAVEAQPVAVDEDLAGVGSGDVDERWCRRCLDRLFCGGFRSRLGCVFGDEDAAGVDGEPDVARPLAVEITGCGVAGEEVERPLAGDQLEGAVVARGGGEDARVEARGDLEVLVDEDRRPGVGTRAVAGRCGVDVVGEAVQRQAVLADEDLTEIGDAGRGGNPADGGRGPTAGPARDGAAP